MKVLRYDDNAHIDIGGTMYQGGKQLQYQELHWLSKMNIHIVD